MILSFYFFFLNIIITVRTQFVTTHNNVGFARKNGQTISLIERGFEKLGHGHQARVSHLVRTKLGSVRSRNLSP